MFPRSDMDLSYIFHFSIDLKAIVNIIGLIISILLIGFTLIKGRKTPLLYSFITFQVLSLLEVINLLVEEFHPDWYEHSLFTAIEYLFLCYIGVSWLIFSLIYTEKKIIARPHTISLLLIPPTLLYLLLLTNNYHHLFFATFQYSIREYEVFYYVYKYTSFLYGVTGIVIMFHYTFKHYGYLKQQSLLLVFSSVIPLIGFLLYAYRLVRHAVIFTTLSFEISILCFTYATLKYKFLNILPFALREIVYQMNDAILVVDNQNKIISYNSSFSQHFLHDLKINKYDPLNKLNQIITENTADTTEALHQLLAAINNNSAEYFRAEINLIKPQKRSFNLNIQPIFGNEQELIGRVFTFHNISDFKQVLDKLNEKNDELSSINHKLALTNQELLVANEQLKEQAAIVEELSIVKERNRIARDVHDTLGHTLILLVNLLEQCVRSYRKDPSETETRLQEAVKITRGGLSEVRRSIHGLMPEKLQVNHLIAAIKELILELQSSGIRIDFSVNQTNFELGPLCSDVVFRVCQEALTNSLRHGQATAATIALRVSEDNLKLHIFDNGRGCENIVLDKGFGLIGLKQRVESLNGAITFDSNSEIGFNIHVTIPLENKENRPPESF
ncbi:MAG TPA: histidine kinase N-terminal 7TM domain-containing protein [Bacillota bacterium]|nr:histidine kinase N-terminal 7TM domain-containing protein [Bacillota bacterium]